MAVGVFFWGAMKDFDAPEFKAQSSLWSTPLTKGLQVGRGNRGVVWMPSSKDEKKRYPFRPKEIRFLHAYISGVPIEDICNKLQLTPLQADKLLKRKRTKQYLSELDEMDAVVLTRGAKNKIAQELIDVWDGKTVKTKQQLEAGKEFWSRVWPKPSDGVKQNSESKFEVKINIGKIEEAVKRQEIIEAEIVNSKK